MNSDSRFKNSGERRPNADQHDEPQKRYEKCESKTDGIHQHAVQQNVQHDRTQYRKREWHIAVKEEQDTRDQLKRENDEEIVRNRYFSEDESKESVQAKNREDQGEKEPTDVSYDLHANTIGPDVPVWERSCFLSQYAGGAYLAIESAKRGKFGFGNRSGCPTTIPRSRLSNVVGQAHRLPHSLR